MESYKGLVQSKAKKFFEAHHSEFLQDSSGNGGDSAQPNFMKWVDSTRKLNEVVENIVGGWGLREFQWVKTNTRNTAPKGGDPRSNAFGSFYSDVLHEIKKLKKKSQ